VSGLDHPSAEDLEQLAIRLVTGAAERVRAADRGRLAVTAKSSATDLVTAADRDTEQWLVEQLAVARPGDAILGEEGGERGGAAGVRWLLDPIDGTVNFVLGLPYFAVSAAAEVDGTVVAGAVANPVSGEVFHARAGGGAWLGEHRLHGPRTVPLAEAVVATGFGYDVGLRSRQAALVADLLRHVGNLRRLGAASLDLCAVAAGRLDGYFETGLNPWDYGAGALIALEAGCVVTGPAGRPPGRELVVAAGPHLAGDLGALLARLGAGTLLQP
jgi:myo-inositol-1(or 4)-monophosphatase